MLKLLKSVFILLFFSGCTPTIKVYTEKINVNHVISAMDMWKVNYSFVKTSANADLIIAQVEAKLMNNPINAGEYHSRPRVVLINKTFYKKLSIKEKINLLSHEIGHYFCIEHTSEPAALMNDRIPLKYRKFSNYETYLFEQTKSKFLLQFYFYRLTNQFKELNW
jgi:hypothetical protein